MGTSVGLVCSFLLRGAYYPVSQRVRKRQCQTSGWSLSTPKPCWKSCALGEGETAEAFLLLSLRTLFGICLPVCFVLPHHGSGDSACSCDLRSCLLFSPVGFSPYCVQLESTLCYPRYATSETSRNTLALNSFMTDNVGNRQVVTKVTNWKIWQGLEAHGSWGSKPLAYFPCSFLRWETKSLLGEQTSLTFP